MTSKAAEHPKRPRRRALKARAYGVRVSSRGARVVLILLGVIALVVGGVFAGQGLNLIPGSFMTGNRMWLYVGVLLVVVGVVLVALGVRRQGGRRRSG